MPLPLSHSSYDQALHELAMGSHQLTAEAGLSGGSRAQQVGMPASQVEGLHGGRMQQRMKHSAHEACVAQVHQPPQTCTATLLQIKESYISLQSGRSKPTQ